MRVALTSACGPSALPLTVIALTAQCTQWTWRWNKLDPPSGAATCFETQDVKMTDVSTCADTNDEMFWRELPAALRTDMALELAGPIFRHSDIFKGLDHARERLVATRLTPLVMPAGHNVVQEGDDADALFLLQEGAGHSRMWCIFQAKIAASLSQARRHR